MSGNCADVTKAVDGEDMYWPLKLPQSMSCTSISLRFRLFYHLIAVLHNNKHMSTENAMHVITRSGASSVVSRMALVHCNI
jgi:hypothetical protein